MRKRGRLKIEDAGQYLQVLLDTLQANTQHPFDLFIVPDIAQWCIEHNTRGAEGNPIAMSVTCDQTKRFGILVRQAMSADQVKGVLDRILMSGRRDPYKLLATPESFLRHLVLHELAHLQNDWDQAMESDCDGWAFDRL